MKLTVLDPTGIVYQKEFDIVGDLTFEEFCEVVGFFESDCEEVRMYADHIIKVDL